MHARQNFRLRVISIIVTLCPLMMRPAESFAEAPTAAGHVVSLNGSAFAKKIPLKAGDAVFPGDLIETMENSGLKLLMVDESILDLGPSTKFRVETYKVTEDDRDVTLGIELGRARAAIQKKKSGKSKFFIRTSASVLAVRGTEFVVNLDRQGNDIREQFTVSEGSIEVTSLAGDRNKPVPLTAGNRMTTVARQAGEKVVADQRSPSSVQVTQVATKETQETVRQNTVQDNTFQQTITLSESSEKPGAPRSQSQGMGTLSQISDSIAPPPPPPPDGHRRSGEALTDAVRGKKNIDSIGEARRNGDGRGTIGGPAGDRDVRVKVTFIP